VGAATESFNIINDHALCEAAQAFLDETSNETRVTNLVHDTIPISLDALSVKGSADTVMRMSAIGTVSKVKGMIEGLISFGSSTRPGTLRHVNLLSMDSAISHSLRRAEIR
jgi:hypothetical protein